MRHQTQHVEELLKIDPEIDLPAGDWATLNVSSHMPMALYWIKFPVAIQDALMIEEVTLGNEILMTDATAARLSSTRFDRRLLPLQSIRLRVRNISKEPIHVSGSFFGTIHFEGAHPYGPQ